MQDIPYLCGLITGDGHLEPKNNRVLVFTSNEDFASKIKHLLNKLGFNCSTFYDKAAKEWKLAVHSKQLKSILLAYGLVSGNKTLTMREPIVPFNEELSFISGLLDAEGYCDLDKGKYWRVHIKMKNRHVVSFVHKALNRQKITARMHKRSDGSYVVEVNCQGDVLKLVQGCSLLHSRWSKICSNFGKSLESSGLHAAYNGRNNGLQLREEKLIP